MNGDPNVDKIIKELGLERSLVSRQLDGNGNANTTNLMLAHVEAMLLSLSWSERSSDMMLVFHK